LVSASIKRQADPNSAHKLIVGAAGDGCFLGALSFADVEENGAEDEKEEKDESVEEGERGTEDTVKEGRIEGDEGGKDAYDVC
jgi:hypothetical protein